MRTNQAQWTPPRNIPWLPALDATAKAAFRADQKLNAAGQGYDAWSSGITTLLTSVTQSSDSKRPDRWRMRGRWGLWFNGGTQQRFMRGTGNPGTFTGAQAQPYWIWGVVRPMGGAVPANQAIFAAGGAPAAGCSVQVLNTSWPQKWRCNAGANRDATSNTINQYNIRSVCFVNNGATDKIYDNGTEVASGSAGNNSWDGFTVGSSGTLSIDFHGMIGELVFGSGAPSAATIQGWHDNYALPFYRLGSPYTNDVLVVFAGDSIPIGFGSTNGDGYRSNFRDYAGVSQMGGRWLASVGKTVDGNWPGDRYSANSGDNIFDWNAVMATPVTGQLIVQPVGISANRIGGEDCANAGGAAHTDAYVPWVAGDPTTTVGKLCVSLAAQNALSPTTAFGISNLFPINPAQTTENTNRLDFNAGLEAELISRAIIPAGMIIKGIDDAGALGAFDSNQMFDQRHPNTLGYDKLWSNYSATPPSGWAYNMQDFLNWAGTQAP